jgi:hypothetical protein
VSTVSRKFSAWMIRLTPLIRWPEREELWDTVAMFFQYAFGKRQPLLLTALKFL